MGNPAFVGVPLLTGNYREAVELSFGIGELNTITGSKETLIRHESILGQINQASASMLPYVSNQPLRLSPSRVSEFENCPQLYKYRVIDELPQPPSLDAERGTLVHTVLHDLFENAPTDRTPKSAIELLPSRWQAQMAEKPELMEMVTNEKEWLDRAESLLRTYFTLEDHRALKQRIANYTLRTIFQSRFICMVM